MAVAIVVAILIVVAVAFVVEVAVWVEVAAVTLWWKLQAVVTVEVSGGTRSCSSGGCSGSCRGSCSR